MLIGVLFLLFQGLALGKDLELTILHVNDIHVRFEETNTYGGTCKESDSCYGGLSRVHYKVNEIRNTEDNVIFLNGGDFYQGNIWYSHYKWRAVSYFGNMLNFTAMALGNHEFDDRVEGLTPLLENASFPIICTNIDVSKEDRLKGKIPGSVVITIEGKRIGIIGYVTKDTGSISRPGKLVSFTDEVEAINKEAVKLKSEGVDILIALGHSGYAEDKRIAANVPDIDLVVGGHSHSFLYTTRNGVDLPSREQPIGDYPTIVRQSNGKSVPVVQAFAYTKYLGRLNVKINERNQVVSWNGAPIILDESVPKDPTLMKELATWKTEIEGYAKEILGRTDVLLLKSRVRETNLGNLITDAMVHHAQSTHDVYLAFMNSGGIRGSFEIGNITRDDLLTVLPFENLIDIVQLRGSTIRAILERSVARMSSDGRQSAGGFLQVSGFKINYHLWKSPGSRLASVLVRQGYNSRIFAPLNSRKLYNVAVPNYLTSGGDGYNLVSENNEGIIKGITPDHILMGSYIKLKSPISDDSIEDYGNRIAIKTYHRGSINSMASNKGSVSLIGIILPILAFVFSS